MDTRILVIDDDATILRAIRDSLEPFGFRIDTADGVEEGVDALMAGTYDIVVTDKNMPDIDGNPEGGMRILEHVKNRFPQTEVVVMTAYASVETAIQAMKLGAFDYLVKPFSMKDLKRKIDRILEYKSFINPENTIRIYKALHKGVLSFIDKDRLRDKKTHGTLKNIELKLDQFFQTQKEWEKIILLQREALAKIECIADEMLETASLEASLRKMLIKVKKYAEKRI